MKDEEVLEAIGRQRGALLGKGKINTQKAAEIVITEFRTEVLGRITLETPGEYAQWLADAQVHEAARAEKKAARARKGKPPDA
jgi:ribosome biogenesis GTPase A